MTKQQAYTAAVAASRKYHDRVTYVLYFPHQDPAPDWDIATTPTELIVLEEEWHGVVTQAYSCGQALH